MKYTESLLWILDKQDFKIDRSLSASEQHAMQEAMYQEKIDFVHSLGERCDCVGWSTLDLSKPNVAEILQKVDEFCKANNWKARGYYDRRLAEKESEWYRLVTSRFKGDEESGCEWIPTEHGYFPWLTIKAYKINKPEPKLNFLQTHVPERFVQCCRKIADSEAKFLWTPDKGRYKGEQYYCVLPKWKIPQIIRDYKYKYQVKNLKELHEHSLWPIINKLGGLLPQIAEIFYKLSISLPDCYLYEDLPNHGMAYAYISSKYDDIGRSNVLLHRDLAEKLVAEKALSESMLEPVYVCKEVPEGYCLEKTDTLPFPGEDLIRKTEEEHLLFLQKELPVQNFTEKDALRKLRAAKKQRNDDFKKGISRKSKAVVAEIESSSFAGLLSYWFICSKGYLSDEYELLDYQSALVETEEYLQDIAREENASGDFSGIVIGKCPDGDRIILKEKGKVIRYSHEVPESIESWKSLPQFICEVLESEA